MKTLATKLLLFNILFALFPVLAQDGSPFQDFGNQGLVLKNFEESSLEINSVSQGTSGRIAVLATEYPILIATIEFIQVFNEDGSIDSSFGDNGYLIVANDTSIPAHNINVLDDNTILFQLGDYITRLLPNGDRDLSFGDNGFITTTSNSMSVHNYALQDDGSIYTSGIIFSNDRVHFIKKYGGNGNVDITFGDNGLAIFPLNPFFNFYHKPIQFLDNGSIMVNYSTRETVNGDFTNTLVRLNQNGVLDASFGNNGSVEISLDGMSNTYFHSFNAGSSLLSFIEYDSSSSELTRKILKLTPNGVPDNNFGTNAILEGYSVAYIQENQRFITTSGAPDWEGGIIPHLSRYFSNGTIDTSFNFLYNYTELGEYAVSPTPNGRILLAGSDIWYNGPDINLLVAQYNNSPLGIIENNTSSIKIFPNPSSEIFIISYHGFLNNKKYTILDASGKLLNENSIIQNNFSINLSQYPAGIYFLQIESQTFKLIKQ